MGLGFSGGDVVSGGVISVFGLLYAALDANPMGQFFRSNCLETRLSYESLEPFMDFQAYLDQKLCHKKQKKVKISSPTKGNQGLNNTPFVYGHNSPLE